MRQIFLVIGLFILLLAIPYITPEKTLSTLVKNSPQELELSCACDACITL